jgi:acyl carrier protein
MERRTRGISRRRALFALAGAAAMSTAWTVGTRTQKAPQKGKRTVDARVPADIRKIVADELGLKDEEVRWESGFVDDLGADSLDLVQLTMAFEERFKIEIPDEDAKKITTVGEVVDYLKKRKVLK